MREVIKTSIRQVFDQKRISFEVWSRFKFNNLARVSKGLTQNVKRFCGLNSVFVEVMWKNC